MAIFNVQEFFTSKYNRILNMTKKSFIEKV